MSIFPHYANFNIKYYFQFSSLMIRGKKPIYTLIYVAYKLNSQLLLYMKYPSSFRFQNQSFIPTLAQRSTRQIANKFGHYLEHISQFFTTRSIIITNCIQMASTVIRATVGRAAPLFKGTAFDPHSNGFKEISLNDYKGKWLLLFFYPLDFTFVCPTQIIEFSTKAKHFRETGCQVVGCSIDSHFTHAQYARKPRADGGLGNIDIPLLSDMNKKVGEAYGVLNDAGISYRGSFIIDQKQVVRHLSINDLPVGRNVDEYLRLVKAFQHADKYGEVCPASWTPGARTMTPGDKGKLDSYWKEVHAKK